MSTAELTEQRPGQRPEQRADGGEPLARGIVHTSAVRRFRPDVEGLRALAVVLVVLYHAGVPFLPGGYVGVDVFFVISGFLITTHLLGEIRTHGRVRLAEFYARRARRLLPLAAVVITATLAASWLLTSALATRQTATDALWTSLLAMNIHLANSGVDYQANTDPSPLQHFWSLAVEEQFYLAWPLLLATTAALAARATRRSARTRTHTTTAIAATIAALATASFIYSVHQTAVAQSLAYFVTPARAWELAAGALIAVGAPALAHQRWLQSGWLTWTGLGAITASAVLYNDQTTFPGTAALLPVLGTAAVITSGLDHATSAERTLLAQPIAQGIGKISYGLYLWHWPMLVLAPAYLEVDQLDPLQALVVVVLSTWLATMSMYLVENPLRFLPAILRPVRTFAAAGGATAAVVAVAVALTVLVPDPRATGTYVEPVTDMALLPAAVTAGNTLGDIPSNVTPTVVAASEDKPTPTTGDGKSCMVDLFDTSLSREQGASCVFGDADSPTTVLLTGDSHAYQWLPALEQTALARGWRLVSLTKQGCPFYDVTVRSGILKREYTECDTWRENVRTRIEQERPALVVTSAITGSESKDSTFPQRWTDGVTASVGGLTEEGIPVAVIADTPYPQVDVPGCLAANLDDASACSVPRAEALSDPQRREATGAAAAAAGATVIDPTPWFCDAGGCPAVIGNTITYSDNSHITRTYSLQLEPLLAAGLPAL